MASYIYTVVNRTKLNLNQDSLFRTRTRHDLPVTLVYYVERYRHVRCADPTRPYWFLVVASVADRPMVPRGTNFQRPDGLVQ